MNIVEKVKDYFKQNVIYYVIFLSCVVYLTYGFVNVKETGKSPHEIIVDSSIILLFGMCTAKLFSTQGILLGEKNEKVIATNNLHAEAVEGINDNIDLLDEFCEEVTEITLRKEQERYLNRAGVKYKDFKDKTYDKSVLDKADKWFIFKAKTLRITPLTSSDLTSDDNRPGDPLYLGKTKKQYVRQSNVSDVVSRLVVAVIFGYYTAKLVENFDWGSLIWIGFQIIFFLLMGVLKMITSYFFIVDDLRARKIRKIDWLTKFKIWVNKKKEEIKDIAEKEENKEVGEHGN